MLFQTNEIITSSSGIALGHWIGHLMEYTGELQSEEVEE